MKTNNINTFFKMENGNHDYNAGNGVSLLVGFMLAFSNSVTGWMSSINLTADWDRWFQALVLGVIGSTATFFTNRFWKYLVEKRNAKKQQQTKQSD